MYRDELEAMQARVRTLEAQAEAEKKQRVAAEAETRLAQAKLAEAKLAAEQTAEKRVRLGSPSTIWVLSAVLALMLAIGVGLFVRVQRHQDQSAEQLREAREQLAQARGRLTEAQRRPPEPRPEPRPAPQPAPAPNNELDALIDRAIGGSDDELPETLGRDQIVNGMKSVKARVQACFDKFRVPGLAVVSVTIAPNGRVSSARMKGVFAGTETGACVPGAVLMARFPRFRGAPITVDYPFILR